MSRGVRFQVKVFNVPGSGILALRNPICFEHLSGLEVGGKHEEGWGVVHESREASTCWASSAKSPRTKISGL